MTDKDKIIKELKEILDSLDVTNKYRLNIIRAIEYLQEEPVSEDLGEEIDNYVKRNGYDGLDSIEEVKYIARHFANWQKQQDQENIELAEDHAMFAGMEKMKENMIAKAIDAEVLENYDGKVIKYDETILDEKLSDCKVFDKVKVIIIKED